MIVRLILVFLLGILWASCAYVSAFVNDEISIQTEHELDNAKYQELYLVKLALEGPFIFLRLLKK
jgi:hypothetical protein